MFTPLQRKIHSHNDYWRDVPVYEALSHGVRSIEADVWLNPKDQRLYVRRLLPTRSECYNTEMPVCYALRCRTTSLP